MRYERFAVVVVFAVGACGPTVWDKPGVTQARFAQENARCQLLAQGMNSGDFYAEGKPAFVAGAALGNAIGTAVARNATYKNCMVASGYTAESPAVASGSIKLKPIMAEATTCLGAVYNSPEAESIRPHVPFEPVAATQAQLTDRAKPTPEEAAALGVLLPRVQECRRVALDRVSKTVPSVVPVLADAMAKGAASALSLQQGQISWGAYNTEARFRALGTQAQVETAMAGTQ